MVTRVSNSPASSQTRSANQSDPSRAEGSDKHVVEKGETMTGIAERHRVALEELVRANPQVRDPNRIEVGQELNIPRGEAVGQTAGQSSAISGDTPRADGTTVRQSRGRAQAADVAARARIEAQVGQSGQTGAERTTGVEPQALDSTGVLRHGQRGPAVSDLQAQLNARGADLDVDGVFGMSTENAVRDFQRQQGLQVDGIVGSNTRAAFARTAGSEAPAPVEPGASTQRPLLRPGHEGADVENLQRRLNDVADAGLIVDGDYGSRTRAAVESFQRRAGIDVDGEAGPQTYQALDEVEAGTRTLAEPSAVPTGPTRPSGPRSREVTVDGNTFDVHDMVRNEFGRRSVPGNRIISMDANSVRGREEILRPLVVIPNDATPTERAAAQQAVDRMAQWMKENLGGDRASTGIVRTTAENGRGLSGFFHTEFHSVNDTPAVNLIKENPEEYARILGGTLGQIPGANFIVPHGTPGRWGPDPGAVSADGLTTEVGLAQHVIRQGFSQL